ncbi:MAG: polyprenyl synthetase family protein, partial [Candidatus Korarchaeota archaeon]|nr:polyprenyl synthetase family protein [Candidatus Korarchaeota archaeon]NIU84217.1 hypothetical protein [Candidatus Thorarchaeota archaeon]NIW14369.1 hypothetical protein [Candidatus Thorarchaeota archaeon]NIW52455.1 hypothetical protein [Candidatus Korarchaeota archaeon]
MSEVQRSYILEIKEWFDEMLVEFLDRYEDIDLHPHLEHALLSKGKRVRPIVVVLAAESMGGSRNDVADLALALELVHTASLVHDDIIDHEELRRGLPSVRTKWSPDDALLAGDVLIALAMELVSAFHPTIIRKMAHAAFELAYGEYLELHFHLSETTEEQYFAMIQKKTTTLFRSAVECVALHVGGEKRTIDALSTFASNFGYAYQLRDDLAGLQLVPEKKQENVENLRVSLPLIHSYSVSDRETGQQLLDLLHQFRDSNGHSPLPKLRKLLEETHSIQYCLQAWGEYLHKARDALTP